MSPLQKPWLLLALVSGGLVGCMRADAERQPSPEERWSTSFPPIDPSEKYFKPGPILATHDAEALTERFAYHEAVIEAHGFSYTIHDNPAVHLAVGELTGLLVPEDPGDAKPMPMPQQDLVSLPQKWDWRTQGAGLPPIRDQGSCGSCWAFGTIAAVEAAIAVSDHQIVDLSEQFVLDCSGEGSCGGGFWAYDILKNQGAALEQAYKYTAWDGACKGASVAHPYKIESYHGVQDGNIDAIKAAIFQYGAVGVTMAVCGSFPGYSGGVYDSTECNWAGSNHIVALVGWDDTVQHHQGHGAWIMRNSWSSSWGDHGYAMMAYGAAGIEENGTYVVYKPEDPTDTDGDGVRDVHDNCKQIVNADQVDADQDGKGDACDPQFDPFEKTLTLSDDDSRKVDLGFSFPFYGTTYTSVNVNSDGNLTFGAGDGQSADRSKSRFLTNAPRIAGLYADLNPAAGGSVTFGKPAQDTLVVRWSGVPVYGKSGANSVTITLQASGAITIAEGAVSTAAAIVGVSKGGNGNTSAETDLSTAGQPIGYAGTGATFEVFGSGKAFDLGSKTIAFSTGQGPGPDPNPGPQPGGETTIALGDDATVSVPLGFSFPFFGKTYADVRVNSDGNVTFGAGDGATVTRSATRFLTGAPRIALLYADLDPSASGTVSYRHDDASSITITYGGVPNWGKATSNTATLKLESSGKIAITYGSVSGSSYVVGVSQGGAGNDAVASDLSQLGAEIGYGGVGAVYQAFGNGASFDLTGKTIVFTPSDVGPSPGPVPPSEVGLSLGDDDTAKIQLGFSFPYFGKTYTQAYVNADGNVTFGTGDGATADRSEARFLTGAPRVALLYSDLDPSAGGSVTYSQTTPQSMTIQYSGVPLWGDASANTARVTLDASGAITVVIDGAGSSQYVVGVSQGGASNGGSFLDLSAAASQSIAYSGTGAVYEVFDPGALDLVGTTLVFAP